MKYTYAYKTPDGVRHEAVMDASSREEVFETLRGRGIKAIKVVAADGSKANGEVRGVRARMVAVLVALAATVAGAAAWWLSARAIQGEGGRPREPHGNVPTDNGGGAARVTASSSPRHQIYGDPAVMEAFERGEFAKELPREGDRLLAVFAQPGRLMCPRGANPRKLAPGQAAAFEAYARDELSVESAPTSPTATGRRAPTGGGSMNVRCRRRRYTSVRAASSRKRARKRSGTGRTPHCAASASAPYRPGNNR